MTACVPSVSSTASLTVDFGPVMSEKYGKSLTLWSQFPGIAVV